MEAIAVLCTVIIEISAYYIFNSSRIMQQCRNVKWVYIYNNTIIQWIRRINITHHYIVILILFSPLCITLIFMKYMFIIILGNIAKILFMTMTLFYFIGNSEAYQYESIFIAAHERTFGILFWFSILGPIGALLYWFMVIMQKNSQYMHLTEKSNIHTILSWIPVRITGFIYSLVGNFTHGFKCWLFCMRNISFKNNQFLIKCGQASIDTDENPRDDENLVLRSYIAWTILCMLIIFLK